MSSKIQECPYCENQAEHFAGTDSQAEGIYCTECPLGVEDSRMDYDVLLMVWNSLPRNSKGDRNG